jgi:uncharacterized protein YndB with AHSA1/START domain
MGNEGLIARASTTIDAPVATVWDALTNPSLIKQFMFGTETVSDWKEGSPIVWKGVWEGKPYEDKGKILKIEPQKTLQVTHFSPLSGVPDVPENYHTLTYELSSKGEQTEVSLSQDNNATDEEREHSQQMWESLLSSLKKVLEG